jgi:hypothetical protein
MMKSPPRLRLMASLPALLVTASGGLCLQGCGRSQARTEPVIEFTRLPPAETDSPEKLNLIQGRVRGAKSGDRLVVYSLNSVWQVQLPERRFIGVQADGAWRSQIHPGAVYGAILVDPQYHPPTSIDSLPEKGGSVLAVASARGTPTPPASFLQFSGYQWEVRRNTNGDGHYYDTANARTVNRGLLHLRISKIHLRSLLSVLSGTNAGKVTACWSEIEGRLATSCVSSVGSKANGPWEMTTFSFR